MRFTCIILKNILNKNLITNTLSPFGTVSFLDAITREEIIHEKFDFNRAALMYGRRPRLAEAGCALSHRKAMEDASAHPWTCIVEDDFLLPQRPGNFFKEVDLNSNQAPIVIILGQSKTVPANLWWQKFKQLRYQANDFGLDDLCRIPDVNFFGAVGYLINSSAANIVKRLPRCFWIADDWRVLGNAGINILHKNNPLIYEDLESPSSTGNERQTLHSLFSKKLPEELLEGSRAALRRLRRSFR